MSFVKSSNIKIFPLSKNRSYTDSDGTTVTENSRSLFEYRIANIIRQIVDVDGFVISNPTTTYGEDGRTLGYSLAFDLYGYLVNVNKDTLLTELDIESDSKYIWACIGLNVDTIEIHGQDVEDQGEYQYQGVDFIATSDLNPPSPYTATLLILSKEGDTWKVPKSSKYKFKSRSVGVTKIDGKH